MITVREVIAITALNFGVEPVELIGENRDRHATFARHVAMYVASKLTGHTSTAIGAAFGGRDHTTVLYGIDRVETELKAAPQGPLAALIASLKKNVEFRQMIEAQGGVDVLAVARRIAAAPLNNAIGASTMETAALAATVLDLWEVALAAEEMARLNARRNEILSGEAGPAGDDDYDDIINRIDALGGAITDEMAALRGENTQEEKTHERTD